MRPLVAEKYKKCNVEGCEANSHYTSKGVGGHCAKHYTRLARHGSTSFTSRAGRGEAHKWCREISLDETTKCITWPFGTLSNGYACISVDGSLTTASRYICSIYHGPPSRRGLYAAHSCGNGHLGCVNPNHLRWATPSQNCKDKATHGTDPSAERSPVRKLSWHDVRAIREMAKSMSHGEISEFFPVRRENISYIVRGATWKDPNYTPPD